MIIFQIIDLLELKLKGKDYPWQRPRCHTKTWGHGFIRRYFDEIADFVMVKRFRCPICRKIFTILPKGYFPRYQTSIEKIYVTLHNRIRTGRWPPGSSRQRVGHWLRKFSIKARMDFPGKQLSDLLEWLFEKQINFFI